MNGRNMNLHQIQSFLALAEEGSFSAAASRLFTTQPAVSYQIKSLEKALGIALFKRTTTRVTLTEEGKKLLPIAKEIDAQFRKFFYTSEDLRGKSDFILGLPRVMMVYTRSYYEDIIHRLSKSDPTLSLSAAIIPHPDKTQAVLQGEVDIQMSGVFPPIPSSLGLRNLFLSNASLAMSRHHPLAKSKKILPAELSSCTVYADASDDTFTPSVISDFSRSGIRLDVKYLETLDFSVPKLLKSHGVALTSTVFSSSADIVYRPLDIEPRQISLFWLKEKESTSLLHVVDIIEETYSQMGGTLLRPAEDL